MIYFKKRNIVKKLIRKVIRKTEEFKLPVFSFSKAFFIFIGSFLAILYFSYLFLTPKFFNEENIEKIINNYVLKNSKLILDVSNLTLKPDYKFCINLKADYIKLKYSKNTDFIAIKNPNIDMNLFSLIQGNIDLDKIKTKSILINTSFNKDKKYECFKYFDIKKTTSEGSKFKLRNINLYSDKITLKIKDTNINKTFYINSSDFKITSNELRKNINIVAFGEIKTSNHKISDYKLNLLIKIAPKTISVFKAKLEKLNYNPLKDAYQYKFYSNANINLKINPNDKKSVFIGTIALNDYSFIINNFKLPKNNILLAFKENKIHTNCDFNLIKNQNIKVKATISTSNNKFIEAKLISNEINLSDFKDILNAFYQIFNFKTNFNNILVKGVAFADLYLKSNFKTVTSKGKLEIKNAELFDKKTGLKLQNINSRINLENNTVNIINTSAYINDAKFNLIGLIDNQTNLNIKINSDLINIAQVINLVHELPLCSKILPYLNDYDFKDGLLKINALIKGKLTKPIIESNSKLENLKLFVKAQKLNINIKEIHITANPKNNVLDEILLDLKNISFNYQKYYGSIPNIKIKLTENIIEFNNTKIIVEKIPVVISGIIKNYQTKQNESIFSISSNLPKNNDLFIIKNDNIKLTSTINIKQDKLAIQNCVLKNQDNILANITGNISNLFKEPNFQDFKIIIENPIELMLPKFENIILNLKGNITLNNKIKSPNIIGKIIIDKLTSNKLNLDINNILLNIKDNEFYINILKGHIFDFDFDAIIQAKYLKNKVIIDSIKFQSMYINLDNLNNYIKSLPKENLSNYEVRNIKGNILTFEASDYMLNSLVFEGKIIDNIFDISNFSANIFNGFVTGKLNINLLNEKTKAELILKELNVRQLSSKLKELSIAVSGKLSALINSEFQGFEVNNILKTFDGYIKFNIDNGELNQFAKLERFLQAGNILSQSILKLSLNSTLSALTKQNTGDFKTIEGTLNIKNSKAQIQYIKTQGSNMSLYITGYFNLITQYGNMKILGRIPSSMVNVMGNFGKFSLNQKVQTLDDDTKDTIETITASPIEKIFSTKISQEDLDKIPQLAYMVNGTPTREFVVYIDGIVKNISSINNFKWNSKL